MAIPTVLTATSLLSSWIGPLIAQFETESNGSQFLFFLADLREFSTSGQGKAFVKFQDLLIVAVWLFFGRYYISS